MKYKKKYKNLKKVAEQQQTIIQELQKDNFNLTNKVKEHIFAAKNQPKYKVGDIFNRSNAELKDSLEAQQQAIVIIDEPFVVLKNSYSHPGNSCGSIVIFPMQDCWAYPVKNQIIDNSHYNNASDNWVVLEYDLDEMKNSGMVKSLAFIPTISAV